LLGSYAVCKKRQSMSPQHDSLMSKGVTRCCDELRELNEFSTNPANNLLQPAALVTVDLSPKRSSACIDRCSSPKATTSTYTSDRPAASGRYYFTGTRCVGLRIARGASAQFKISSFFHQRPSKRNQHRTSLCVFRITIVSEVNGALLISLVISSHRTRVARMPRYIVPYCFYSNWACCHFYGGHVNKQ